MSVTQAATAATAKATKHTIRTMATANPVTATYLAAKVTKRRGWRDQNFMTSLCCQSDVMDKIASSGATTAPGRASPASTTDTSTVAPRDTAIPIPSATTPNPIK